MSIEVDKKLFAGFQEDMATLINISQNTTNFHCKESSTLLWYSFNRESRIRHDQISLLGQYPEYPDDWRAQSKLPVTQAQKLGR